jgi:hypothetical protein
MKDGGGYVPPFRWRGIATGGIIMSVNNMITIFFFGLKLFNPWSWRLGLKL